MVLKLYNSLTRKKEVFKPVIDGLVRIYTCGPTVYSYASVGNFRSFMFVDILKRFLKFKGFKVKHVVNITDVGHLTDDSDSGDDKMELAARREKKHPLEIAKFYTDAFLKDWKTLNMEEPDFRPRATEMIPEIIALAQKLLENGHAYVAGGNVYYDITTFPDYGKLSGNTIEKLTKHRVDADPNKRNPQDFVLWFGNSKFKNHILKWDSPWGEGYPGWHAECTCMSTKFLTDAFKDGKLDPDGFQTIDIHTGGEDNKFPHHECEIAQTEGALNKKYVNYWLHAKHLMVEGQKMSKSLGNVYYVFDLVKEGFSPRAIRYLLLSTHYRQSLNFTKDGLRAVETTLSRIDETIRRLAAVNADVPFNDSLDSSLNKALEDFESFLDDDLNISGALGVFFDSLKLINKALDDGLVGNEQASKIIDYLFRVDEVLGVMDHSLVEKKELPPELKELLDLRAKARSEKDWATSDRIRDELRQKGVEVIDTKNGQQWRFIN